MKPGGVSPDPACDRVVRAFGDRLFFRGNPDRRGEARTHRGYECRFQARTDEDRDAVVVLLERAGIHPGRPFLKGAIWRVPVYGKEPCERLRAALDRVSRAR